MSIIETFFDDITDKEAFETYTATMLLAPFSYQLISYIPSLYNYGTLPASDDVYAAGYGLTWYTSVPFLIWYVVCQISPSSYYRMEIFYNISLFGPFWLYLFAPYYDTIIYLSYYRY